MERIPNRGEWVTIPKGTPIYQYGEKEGTTVYQYGEKGPYKAGKTYKVRVWRVMEAQARNFPDSKGETFMWYGEPYVDVVAWFVGNKVVKMAPLEAVKEIPSDMELLSQVPLDNPRRRS